MPRRDPFRGHRFPKDVIWPAVRWYCRYPLSCRDVRDMLAERGIAVDAATVYRWVQSERGRATGPSAARTAPRSASGPTVATAVGAA